MNKSILISLLFPGFLWAQQPTDKIKSTGFPGFPKIENNKIPGAPILGQPQLITGSKQEIRVEKHGLAYPAFYDWNGDGKLDLLVGEFETGQTGSDIKVYLNEGTNKKPKYSGEYFYAKDNKGNVITNHQWCCIGIHPRFIDIDHDGHMDILSGQYNPGLISYWKGSKEGFEPRQFIPQEGYVEGLKQDVGSMDQLNPKTFYYWTYSSAGFADFNGDGLEDLFIGGMRNMRYALNEGTKEKPKFGFRQYLLGLDGLPISLVGPSALEMEDAKRSFRMPNYGGVEKGFITPIDWDGDGVLDLLVTDVYARKETKDPIVFFRGVHTDKGLRFEKGIPLFTSEQAKKTFPGCHPNILITDYNQDGVADIVFGISLPTINGYQIDTMIANSYLHDLGLETPGKDAGRAADWAGGVDNLIKQIESNEGFKRYYLGKLDDNKYLTLRHRGFVYVMYGKKNPEKAIRKKGVSAEDEVKIVNQISEHSKSDGPVSYAVNAPAILNYGGEGEIEVVFSFKEGWHGYADNEVSKRLGFIPTKVEFEFPEGYEAVGALQLPVTKDGGGYPIYKGDQVRFVQRFKCKGVDKNKKMLKPGQYTIVAKLFYQTCNESGCLPPQEDTVALKINF